MAKHTYFIAFLGINISSSELHQNERTCDQNQLGCSSKFIFLSLTLQGMEEMRESAF